MLTLFGNLESGNVHKARPSMARLAVARVAERSGHIGMMRETGSEPVLSLDRVA